MKKFQLYDKRGKFIKCVELESENLTDSLDEFCDSEGIKAIKVQPILGRLTIIEE